MAESNEYFRMEWRRMKEELIASLQKLGYPAALGNEIAKNLGSPKAINRMISYLDYVKPEIIYDRERMDLFGDPFFIGDLAKKRKGLPTGDYSFF